VDEFCPELDGRVGEGAICVDAPPNTLTRFQNRHCLPCIREIAGGSQPGCSSADHECQHATPISEIACLSKI
jgi:hypothetical protein